MKLLDSPAGGGISRPGMAQGRMSHCMLVEGVGGNVIGDYLIGTITLPAGGPWIIYGCFGTFARITATALESTAGYMFLRAVVGDLIPNPSPSRFPLGNDGSFVGATADAPVDPLHFTDTTYSAPGKSVIELWFHQSGACTAVPIVQLGVVFGLQIPYFRPVMFMDNVDVDLNLAAEVAVGMITLAERATRITHVGGVLHPTLGFTTAEEIIGHFRLASDDVKLEPAIWPFSCSIGAGLGGLIQCSSEISPFLIPVDIPVPGGARIDVFATLVTALAIDVEAEISVGYEMG